MAVSLLDTHAEVVFLRCLLAQMWAEMPQPKRNAAFEAANRIALESVDNQDARLALGKVMSDFQKASGLL